MKPFLIPLLFAGFKLLIHFSVNANGGYGYFRDELYYVSCTENPDFGYVDHPPLSIWVLSIGRLMFGDSIFGLRLIPAVAGALTVFLTGAMTVRLGGQRVAQLLSCLAASVSLIYLAVNSYYSMNSLDILLWTATAYIAIRLFQTGDSRYWLVLGILIGIGAMNKIGMIWFAVGLYAGCALTPERKWFATKWPWVSAATALMIFAPFIIWNVTHDFAHLEFMRNAMSDKYSSQTPLTFLSGQLLLQNPVTIPLWLGGLAFMFVAKELRFLRVLGLAFLIVVAVLIMSVHAKPEYLAPAYAMLFASGGVWFERFSSIVSRQWIRPALIAFMATGFALVPAALPILPVETYITYAKTLGINPSTAEGKELGELPQFYADMLGWEEKAEAVARVFKSLTLEEQQHTAIYADNYGRCAAIDFFGRKHGLPRTIGSHNNYWIWGLRGTNPVVVIILGGDEQDHRQVFAEVSEAALATCNYCMPYENNLKIYVCRKPMVEIGSLWENVKHYD